MSGDSSPIILGAWCVSVRGARTWGAAFEVLEFSFLHLNLRLPVAWTLLSKAFYQVQALIYETLFVNLIPHVYSVSPGW